MTSIEVLEIAGIRSFSPDAPQTIKFYKPLTVIVGDNGCGKTTIIECLKYATMGAMPENSERGHAFVHDPRLAGASEVKASVRLRFRTRDPRGLKIFEVTRLIQVTQARVKTTMKQLDGVLTIKNESNEVIERLSQRCTDLDKTIPTLLGISPAILENVVFCHQEDASWPMQDGALLKKKFDDIFESTRYSKALDDVRKKRKALNEDAKASKAELDVLRAHQEVAHTIQEELAEKQSQAQQLHTRFRAIKGEVEDFEKQEAALAAKLAATGGKRSELERLRGQLQAATEEQRSAYAVVERDDFVEDLERNTLAETEAFLQQLEQQIQTLDSQSGLSTRALQDLRVRKSRCDEELNKRAKEKGRLEEGVKHLDDVTRQVMDKVQEVSRQFGLAPVTLPLTDTAVTRVSADLEQVQAKHKEALSKARSDRRAAVDAVDLEANRSRMDVDRARDELLQKQKHLARVTGELRQVLTTSKGPSTTPEVRASAKRVEEARDRLRRAEAEASAYSPIVDLAAVARDKADLTASIASHRSALASLESLRNLHNQSMEKRSLIAVATSRIEARVRGLLTRVPSPGCLKDALMTILNASKTELKLKEEAVTRNNAELSQKLGEVASLETSKQRVEADIRGLERGPLKSCLNESGDMMDVVQILAQLRAEVNDLGDSQSSLTAFSEVLQRFRTAASDRNKCLACSRVFKDGELETALASLDALKAKLARPGVDDKRARLEELKSEIRQAEENVQLFNSWTNKKETLHDLDNRIVALAQPVHLLHSAKSEADTAASTVRERVTLCNSLLPDVLAIDRDFADFSKLEEDVEALGGEDRVASSEQEVEEAMCRITEDEAKLVAVNRLQQDADSRKFELERARLDALNEVRVLEVSTKLTAEKAQLEKEIAAITESQPGLASEVSRCEANRDDISRQCDKSIDAASALVSAGSTLRAGLSKLVQDWRDAGSTNPRARLEEIGRDEARLRSEMDGLHAQVRAKEQEAQAAATTRAGVMTLAAKTEHLLRYKNAKVKREAIDEAILALNKQMLCSEGELANVMTELQDVRAQLMKQRSRYANYRGSYETFKVAVKECEAKLNNQKFYDIDERCRDVMIKYETAVLAVADLDQYYKALDTALTHYHDMKIREINAIIRDLWTNTYKGKDIESIEIRSNLEDDAGGDDGVVAAASARKRTFNYRVVMSKGPTELNMKGRCSAGQKVLASLVIRLALAESFCLSCGILALDEPTTNLDRENKEGLAKAIADIIDSKREQSNFQLIVITHEGEFVDMLSRHVEGGGAGPGLGHYFHISREESPPSSGRFHSLIRRQEYH